MAFVVHRLAAGDLTRAPGSRKGDGERRQLTILFCDIVGSVELAARMDAEELQEVMGAFRASASAVVARYAGHVAQHLGDGLLAYFGWPQAQGDDAERAVRAALELIDPADVPRFAALGAVANFSPQWAQRDSYTIDTLRLLRAKLAPARLAFIVGEDAFAELDLWREPAVLLTLADFAVMTRPPSLGKPLRSLISEALAASFEWAADGESGTHRSAETSLARVPIDALDVSATDIRRRIRMHESVRYLLPEAIHDAVIASGAYETT